jgi:hypothetical protein
LEPLLLSALYTSPRRGSIHIDVPAKSEQELGALIGIALYMLVIESFSVS